MSHIVWVKQLNILTVCQDCAIYEVFLYRVEFLLSNFYISRLEVFKLKACLFFSKSFELVLNPMCHKTNLI